MSPFLAMLIFSMVRVEKSSGLPPLVALVLVNLGGATGSEVVKLAEEVVRSVKEKFGVAIHPEVNFIGVKQ